MTSLVLAAVLLLAEENGTLVMKLKHFNPIFPAGKRRPALSRSSWWRSNRARCTSRV
jgi:hypothetical protein